MKAERETSDRLIAHFLADRIGAVFDGHISGVTRAGLFVELDETGADGFIPARHIGEEYFRFHEVEPRLRRGLGTHRLGDPVTVELVEAAPVAGALRFKLVRDASAPAQRTRQPPPKQRKFARGRNHADVSGGRLREQDVDEHEYADPMIESGSCGGSGRTADPNHSRPDFPNRKPRDSATLILIDRSEERPQSAARPPP